MLDKLTFLNNLKVFLFDVIEAALVIRLGVIYEDQAKLVPESEVGFYYKGTKYLRYGYESVPSKYKHRFKPLHESLAIAMDTYLEKSEDLHSEWNYISSYVRCILNQCGTAAQLYLALPTGLHGFLNQQGITGSIEDHACDFDIGNNQLGKELLLTRLMLNMTGD